MSTPFYITTPIYYVTDAPHIGHLYSTVAADVLARYHRRLGEDVWFLTGTDEHGQKIEKKARENKETPQALADRVVERYVEAWKLYGISNNDFIRTTEERHKKVVGEYLKRLIATGDVYLSEYEGWYCVPDETYWTETQVIDGKCPDCGRPVEKLKEESYFFKMSAYQDKLVEHIRKNPDFIQPESRKNEVLGFVQQGLRDISISRTTIQWGIPMPHNPKATKDHKVYVWFDALTNYLSALGPLENDPKLEKFWPGAVHIVGKDILRFHAVYWPTFLMALGISLPKSIVAHGWLTDAHRKISKSLGNAIDPVALASEVGVDGMRYFLLREFAFGLDGEYTKEVMYRRINADLANDYGNCLSRTVSMMEKYLGTKPIEAAPLLAKPSALRDVADGAFALVDAQMEHFHFERALEQIWKILTEVNRSIETTAPWALAKSQKPEDRVILETALVHWHESLRVASHLLVAFIPESAQKALAALGDTAGLPLPLSQVARWGKGPKELCVAKVAPLFPRLELKTP